MSNDLMTVFKYFFILCLGFDIALSRTYYTINMLTSQAYLTTIFKYFLFFLLDLDIALSRKYYTVLYNPGATPEGMPGKTFRI